MKINVKRIVLLVFGIMLMIATLNSVFTYSAAAFSHSKETYLEITVQRNDTLWCIAEKITPEGKDMRNTVYQIRKINNLDSVILQPGQQILVPKLRN